jgi:hypothetical protein
MSTPINDGGYAFPQPLALADGQAHIAGEYFADSSGMTLRQYAAIKLRVPKSGVDWLDKMIVESQRNEFAGQALGAYLAGRNGDSRDTARPYVAKTCYEYADAMLKAREVKP